MAHYEIRNERGEPILPQSSAFRIFRTFEDARRAAIRAWLDAGGTGTPFPIVTRVDSRGGEVLNPDGRWFPNTLAKCRRMRAALGTGEA